MSLILQPPGVSSRRPWNASGIWTLSSPTPARAVRRTVAEAEVETFEEILKVNVTSTFFLVQAAEPYLNPGACIFFNGSQMSLSGRPGFSAYAASKGALRAMSRVMASELSPRRIPPCP
jgi:NAD(P)-dependent dehydrogenase (short-subunit alcohol dehydrogenase family)